MRLIVLVNAAYGTGNRRRSVTGLYAIAYCSKLKDVVATSSTEAEFIVAVQAVKMAKYLCNVLHELGFEQDALTPLYEDNKAAIAMIDAKKPTP
jgi:hypothetical protein